MRVRLWLPLLTAVIASGQTINTFAGDGTAGYLGDAGPATQAEINRVVGLATDAAGNIYLADQNNNVVRKVDTHGVITTFAGTGTAGFAGDNGQAAAAQLNGPLGVCVAPSGAIYVNDEGNGRVRAISTTGIITTVAGNGSTVSSGDDGPAVDAGFVIPIRCAVDSSGNLFIVDQGAFKIRKVDGNGIITTYAGTGAQGFSGDNGPATQAVMTSPAAGSVLGGSTVTFTWSASVGGRGYSLWLGSTGAGSDNLYSSHETTGTSVTAKGLPTNGETIYARLFTNINGSWEYNDYTFIAK